MRVTQHGQSQLSIYPSIYLLLTALTNAALPRNKGCPATRFEESFGSVSIPAPHEIAKRILTLLQSIRGALPLSCCIIKV
jgi:hypothetical protein